MKIISCFYFFFDSIMNNSTKFPICYTFDSQYTNVYYIYGILILKTFNCQIHLKYIMGRSWTFTFFKQGSHDGLKSLTWVQSLLLLLPDKS